MRYQFWKSDSLQPTIKMESGKGVATFGRHWEVRVAILCSVRSQRISWMCQRFLPAELTRISPPSERMGGGKAELCRVVSRTERFWSRS